MVAPAPGFYATPGLGRDEVRIAYVLKEADLRAAVAILAEALPAYRAARGMATVPARAEGVRQPDFSVPAESWREDPARAMAEPIVVTPGVVVPAAALSLHTSRSSGPGGQNVNKVASKVELRVDLDRVEGLPAEARTRLGSLARRPPRRRRPAARGQPAHARPAPQPRGRAGEGPGPRAARMIRPRTRRPTRVTAAAKARRLDEKKRRSAHKRRRGTVRPDED